MKTYSGHEKQSSSTRKLICTKRNQRNQVGNAVNANIHKNPSHNYIHLGQYLYSMFIKDLK